MTRYAASPLFSREKLPALVIVAAAHLALGVAVLRGSAFLDLETAVLEAARGGGTRMEVALLTEALPPEPTSTPDAITAPPSIAVELEAPADLGLLDPEAERLQGLYLGQIRARIERMWHELLGARLPARRENCRVVIEETARGEVHSVQIERCSDPTLEPAILEEAIRLSSPLPAPPGGLERSPTIALELSIGGVNAAP